MVAGGLLIVLCGALRHWRGVNATISSLLLAYIAIYVFNFLVEGPLRDPSSLEQAVDLPDSGSGQLGTMFGLDVHWGLAYGIAACVLAWILMDHTTFGFAGPDGRRQYPGGAGGRTCRSAC